MTQPTLPPPIAPATPPSSQPLYKRLSRWLAFSALIIGFALILLTELGLKAGLQYGLSKIPLLTVGAVEGSLLRGFTLRQLRYVTEFEQIELGSVFLDISPRCLLRNTVCVRTLDIKDVDWHINRVRESAPFDFPAVTLPALLLQVEIDVEQAQMNRLTLAGSDSAFDINNVSIRLHTDNQILFLDEVRTDLVFPSLIIRTQADGSLDLRGDTAANLHARVGLDFSGEVKDLDIEGDVRGAALAPELSVTTRGLVEAQGQIKASFREKGWPVYARVKQNAPTPLADAVPVTLSDTVAIISGYVNAYHVEGETRVSGIPRTPVVTAGIITDGGFTGLKNGTVNLRIDKQQADVRGEFQWYPRLRWNAAVDFSQLDMATWLQDATSDLSGSAEVDGEWYLDVPFRNTVQSLRASGRWREHPVSLDSGFTTTAEILVIEHLQATLGRNKIALKGGLAEQWDFNGDFDLPALADVLPQLDGAVRGTAKIRGPRDAPVVQVAASSPRLQIYDTVLDRVTANLDGTPQQHVLTASAEWQGYAAQATLAGALMDQRWLGQVRQLQLTREAQAFALVAPATLRYNVENKHLQLGDACLHAENQQVCATTQWGLTPGKGSLAISMKDFRPEFFNPLLTVVDASPGLWNGSATMQFERFLPVAAEWRINARDWTLARVGDYAFGPAMHAREATLQGRLTSHRQKNTVSSQIESQVDIVWHDTGTSRFDLIIPDLKAPTQLSLALESSPLPIRWAAPWLTGVHVHSGTLGGTLKGNLNNGWPTLHGFLSLQAGKLSMPDKTWGLDGITATLQLDGTTAHLKGSAQDDRGLDWQLSTPLLARWSVTDSQAALEQGCVSTGKSSLCLRGRYAQQTGIDLAASITGNISPWLAPVLTDNALIDGPFEGSVNLAHHAGKLTGDLQLQSTISSTLPTTDQQPAPSMNVTLKGNLADDILLTTLIMQGGERSRVEGQLKAAIAGTKAIDGHIEIKQVNITPLQPMIRELEQVNGNVNGMFLISGTLQQPTIEGQLRLENGKLSSAIYPFAFSKVTAQAAFTQQKATLKAQLESGKRGRATLTSSARWDGGTLQTESRLVGDQIPIKQGSDINLRVNTDLTLASSAGRLDLGGLIHVKEGFLRVAKLPENSTNVSKDVVFVDERGSLDSERGLDAHLNLAVQLSDLVQLDGLGAQVRMEGAVGIQQTPPNDPIGRGSLAITEGTYTGYGQKLKITKGQILFNGPLDNPVLAIKAIREANSADGGAVVAGITISGTPQQPESTLFSVPAMPEQDILYYIVTGRSRQAQRSGDQFAMNQALLSVGLYGSEDFTRDLASKVGIDDFEISTSTDNDDNNSVNVGGYLSPRLFVQYGVGLNTPVNTLTLRYRLTQSVFLEALSGAESALDVLYSFEVE